MSIYEKILPFISLVCFGFCLCLLAVSIDMEMHWSIKLWSVAMLIWHGSYGGVGVYKFIKEVQE